MSDLINIQVDGIDIQTPKGATVVDAAMRGGVKIPVFCHHPKLEPVGMCRMCLVEIGTPMRDRATGELVYENGEVKYLWGRTLQTGCTVRVSEGMRVKTTTEQVKEAREDILEFILSSHPLDCPVCDKGGECPLQNLTIQHGEGKSRFYFGDKMHLDKHVALGELIWLDRERCIQCGRCTRFQAEVVDDPVIAFHNRGRRLEIVTLSDPGFDSIWSGNTTDICPVGALTTDDFRFGARAWELIPVASLNPHGPAGENLMMSTRREAKSGGRTVIKRIMPRQNEWVNETWIPDKARFVHHFVESAERLTKPLIRKNGQLVESSWDEALKLVAEKLQTYKDTATGLAGDRLSNEDLYSFQKLFRRVLKTNNIDLANRKIAGGDVTAQFGIGSGTNLGELGKGDVVAVIASDLHSEVPTWWLRLKQAAQRGAQLIVINLRETRLDKYAAHSVRYQPDELVDLVAGLGSSSADYARIMREATNLIVYYGSEGLSYDETDVIAKQLGNFLFETNHYGRAKNGLVAVWPHCNTQGAWDMGVVNEFAPSYRRPITKGLGSADVYAGKAKAVYIVGADPIGDGLLKSRQGIDFMVVQELFLTETAKSADVVFPAQSWAERDGTWTNGDRRVQRYYPASQRVGESRADWQIIGEVIAKLNNEKAPFAASLIFAKEIAIEIVPYNGMTYRTLAEVVEQYPIVGGEDLYYGGTSYHNSAGVGQQWASFSEQDTYLRPFNIPNLSKSKKTTRVKIVNIPASYTSGTLIRHSEMMQERVTPPTIHVNSADATELRLRNGDQKKIRINGQVRQGVVSIDGVAPQGVVLLQGFGSTIEIDSAELV